MPHLHRWLRSLAGILVVTRRSLAPPTTKRAAPASLREAIAFRPEFGKALDVIVPPATESRLGRRTSHLPDGRVVFEERPCFLVTPQASSVRYGDILVEYRDQLEFQAELAPWVNERASVEIRRLARGTLHLRNVRRTDGRPKRTSAWPAKPSESARCCPKCEP
jgi:hypothetical protein